MRARTTMQRVTSLSHINRKRTLFIVAVVLAAIVPAIAQIGGGAGGELQQKIAAVKQSAAENQQRLHQYQWVETTQLTLKGDAKPPTQQMCQYGPDGKVEKLAMGPPPEPPSGGRLKQRVVKKKKEEMKDYMGDVKNLLGMYVPPDPQRMEQSFRSGNASLNPVPAAQEVGIAFKNYAQPGDQLRIAFAPATKKIVSISVDTYMDDPKDTVTLTVRMATLPDGTNYVEQTVLNATAKQLQVTTTSSNYRRLGGQ